MRAKRAFIDCYGSSERQISGDTDTQGSRVDPLYPQIRTLSFIDR